MSSVKEIVSDRRRMEGFAAAYCPECGEFTIYPLAHLISIHGWPRKKAQKWIKAKAATYRDWNGQGPFFGPVPTVADVWKKQRSVTVKDRGRGWHGEPERHSRAAKKGKR